MWVRKLVDKFRVFVPSTFQNIRLKKDGILSKFTSKPQLKDVIVSLTTYAPRMDFFEYAVLSILNGTVLPEKILIHVPEGFVKDFLAKKISFLEPYYGKGVIEFVEMPVDYCCHSKYYYSFKKYGGSKDIVLCDDDVIYYRRWLENLYNESQRYPQVNVFAYRTQIVKKANNHIESKLKWQYSDKSNYPSDEDLLFVEAVGGVLYRRGSMPKETLNHEVFMRICPKADDVWLWFCSYLNGNNIRFVPPPLRVWEKLFYLIPQTQDVALWINAHKITDGYIEECRKYFIQKYQMDIESMPQRG